MNYPIDYVPSQEDKKFAENNLELARLIAATELPKLLTRLVTKAHDDTSTAKQIQEAAEFTYKVSGLAKRQEEADDRGRFVFNINFSKSTVTVDKSRVVDGEASVVEKPVKQASPTLALQDLGELPADFAQFDDNEDLLLDGFDD